MKEEKEKFEIYFTLSKVGKIVLKSLGIDKKKSKKILLDYLKGKDINVDNYDA
jgi:hypothetical protein